MLFVVLVIVLMFMLRRLVKVGCVRLVRLVRRLLWFFLLVSRLLVCNGRFGSWEMRRLLLIWLVTFYRRSLWLRRRRFIELRVLLMLLRIINVLCRLLLLLVLLWLV